MSADSIAPAILDYISHGRFPSADEENNDSESIISASLDLPLTLSTLLTSLRTAQSAAKDDLRKISRSAASDVDDWISRARALQADILRSRDVARTIIAEAEVAKALRAAAVDQERKVQLLESEVRFNESLTATLQGVQSAERLLAAAKAGVVGGQLAESMRHLEEAESKIKTLSEGRIKDLLRERRETLVGDLKDEVVAAWKSMLKVDVDKRKLRFTSGEDRELGVTASTLSLEEAIDTARSLGCFKSLVESLGKDIVKAIVAPRLAIDRKNIFPTIKLQDEELWCEGETDNSSYQVLFEDMRKLVGFLSTKLPSTVGVPLSETLVPVLTTKMEEGWLTPAIPLSITEMSDFQKISDEVLDLAERIDAIQWYGGQALREWVQGMPRLWLTKKREHVLGDIRNLVFTGLRETKVVERVETQTVTKDEDFGTGGEGVDDDWNTAWDESEEQPNKPEVLASKDDEEDDDASAWDVDDPGEKQHEEDAAETGEEDAWGWGDGEDVASTPVDSKNEKKDTATMDGPKSTNVSEGRQMTLRELYTITGVPDDVIARVQQIILDAETLGESEYASLPIAPAASALYTLPTLALAIYRATAPTSYGKLGISNMLIYNDASRLSDQLRSWQTSQPPASRLRLDNDVKALDQFAKRAYSGEMESQRTILRDLLDGTQGFSNCAVAPFKAECEAAVEQTIHRLRDVHKQWTGILPPSALLQSVGSLLATVTGKMITDVEDLPDISEADSKELKVLCDNASTIRDLFVQQAADGSSNDMTFIYCPNWLKFQYLGELMESSLADIKYLWKEGELSLEFDADEVVGLIEALFAESQLRRQAITEIRRGSKR